MDMPQASKYQYYQLTHIHTHTHMERHAGGSQTTHSHTSAPPLLPVIALHSGKQSPLSLQSLTMHRVLLQLCVCVCVCVCVCFSVCVRLNGQSIPNQCI